MNILIAALIAWAASTTGLPAAEPPNLIRVTRCQLAQMHSVPCDARAPVSAYWRGHVFIEHRWNRYSLRDRSYLLHEIVHHLQYRAGMRMGGSCHGPRIELPAYEAQADWLHERGADPVAVTGHDAAFLSQFATCGVS